MCTAEITMKDEVRTVNEDKILETASLAARTRSTLMTDYDRYYMSRIKMGTA